MLNNQEDSMECGKCKCTHNLLQCEAIKCSGVDDLARKYTLLDLVALMKQIESYAYRSYVNELIARGTYQIVYRDLNNNDTAKKMAATAHDDRDDHDPPTTPQKTKVIVFKSGRPSHLIGLYFMQQKKQRPIDKIRHFNNTSRLSFNCSVIFNFVLFYSFLNFFLFHLNKFNI